MKRREFLVVLGAAAASASPVMAKDRTKSIVARLKGQGYSSVVTSRTLLGRVRILASRRNGLREIILNPVTGEILRDVWLVESGSGKSVDIVSDGGSDDDDDDDGGGDSGDDGESDGGGDIDDDDDDDDDDDEADD